MVGKIRTSIVVAVVFMSAFYIVLTVIPENAKASTLFVGGSGPGNYTTIQSAIDAANTGDTIYVYSGIYNEHLIVNKTLSLKGEDRDTTIIDGGGFWDVVYVDADWVNITGFTVTNGGSDWDDAGIKFFSVQNSSITDCNVSSNSFVGVYLHQSNNNTIAKNTLLSNNMPGIYLLLSDHNTVAGNNLSKNFLGIALIDTMNNTFVDNMMLDDGIFVNGDSLEYWNTHIMDTSNTVNGRPVRYWKDTVGGTIPPGSGQVILANCSGVIVENQNVSHGAVGINLGYSSGNIIANNIASDSAGGISLWYSDANVVTNNTASRNTWRGISDLGSNDNRIDNNIVSLNIGAGIAVHSSTNTTVFDNGAILNDGVGIYVEDSHDVNVIGNRVLDNSNAGIIVLNSDNNTIANNTASGGGDGLYIRQSNNNTIVGNTASTWDDIGIHLYESTTNLIEANDLSTNTYGIYLSFDSNHNTIVNNDASSNGFGISFYSSHNNTAVNNTASWNSRGFSLRFSDYNIILNNSITDNWNLVMDGTGVEMINSDHNFIICNNISDNEYGVVFSVAFKNEIAANTFYSNSMYGLLIDIDSSGNQIFHNNFVDNIMQADDWNSSNKWDDDYPSGGNYWSDYAGLDVLFGPNQDQPGKDGIGDTPYAINWDTKDRFPLMSPVGACPTQPPTSLNAELTGKNYENVTLTWDLSVCDIDGKGSIKRYDILRFSSYSSDPSGYLLHDSVSKGTSLYVDIGAGEGEPNDYFYVVCAVDWNGNSSCSRGQAAKYTRQLVQGINLVSIPLVQLNESVQKVLRTVRFDKAWSCDAWDAVDPWKWYMTSKPYKGDLKTINHKMGVWVNVTEESNFTVAGIVPLTTSIQLYTGWNLVSFPSFNSSYSVSDLKAETGAVRIEGSDLLVPPYFLEVLSDTDVLEAGHGYWIFVQTNTTWIARNS